jgi:VTC domain
MNKNVKKTLKSFSSISLEQLNSSVSFLDRIDVKYLIHEAQLSNILEQFKEHFYVLEIAGHTIFTYDNVYMDTKNLAFYNQHQNQQDNRMKVRSRLYTESHYSFFECKQKSGKTTRKFRFQQDELKHGLLYNELLSFHNGVYQTLYGNEQKELIFPAIKTKYHRITLCSKNNDERVTIDFNLHFEDLRSEAKKGKKQQSNHLANTYDIPNLVMIESKSMSTNCVSHGIMKDFKVPTAKACSKYCLGQYYFEKVKEWSTFQDTINTIEKIKRAKTSNEIDAVSMVLPSYDVQELVLK